jgi:SOS response regulatory protein OraA/RecX
MEDQALETALKYLNNRAMTTQRLTDKLLQDGFTTAAVTECVARVSNWGYLNDYQFGVDRLRLLQTKLKSRNYIEADLRHAGLEQRLVGDLLDKYYPEATEVDIARKLIARKFAAQKDAAAKMEQYLLRTGFSEDTVSRCFLDRSSP